MNNLYIGKKQLETVIDSLQHHEKGLTYVSARYISKIPTKYKVKYNGRLYRVYSGMCSSIGTLYIVSKGKKITVRDYPL